MGSRAHNLTRTDSSRLFGSVILLVGLVLAVVAIAELARDDVFVGIVSLVGALSLIGVGGAGHSDKK